MEFQIDLMYVYCIILTFYSKNLTIYHNYRRVQLRLFHLPTYEHSCNEDIQRMFLHRLLVLNLNPIIFSEHMPLAKTLHLNFNLRDFLV